MAARDELGRALSLFGLGTMQHDFRRGKVDFSL